MGPELDELEPRRPTFSCGQVNVIVIRGRNLAGATLDWLNGSCQGSQTIVDWDGFEVQENSSDHVLVIRGTPTRRGGQQGQGGDGADPGDVQVGVTNNGQQVEQQFTCDYQP